MREIPSDLLLSADDLLYLRHSHLAQLTATDPSYWSAWLRRRQISERKLGELAERLCVSKGELLSVIDAKRAVQQRAQIANAKAERLFQFLQQQEGGV